MKSDETHTAGHDEEGAFDPTPYRPTPGGLRRSGISFLLVVLCALLVGVVPRLRARASEAAEQTAADKEPFKVAVHKVTAAAHSDRIQLPSSIEPLQETVVYARTNGYVRLYNVDIGDKVRAGQILAELDTPDIDQELHQAQALVQEARASVGQARTQRDLARVESQRYTNLAPSGVVSAQEQEEHQAAFETHSADVQAAEASLNAAEANLRRLQEIKSFATVRSPFAGVITLRNVEKGQLVVAGTSNGQAMFKVDRTDTVRIFVNVPQAFAPGVKVGSPAPTTVRNFPNQSFAGKVTRTANALDPQSRTLLTEVRIANPNDTLMPGMYAQVNLDVEQSNALMLVPSAAVYTAAEGTRVAVVEAGAIRWRQIVVDADLGTQITVTSGVSPGELVVNMPSSRLLDGMQVTAEEIK